MYNSGSKLLSSLSSALVDKFGRQHNYLRISLTEKCNLRCRYCMPAEGIKLSPSKDCLQLDELKRLTNVFVERCGVKKIRLTGGEPTVSKDLIPLLIHLSVLRGKGLHTVAITTNGVNLADKVDILEDLGVNLLNISLDTLRSDRFQYITRRKGFNRVIDGFERAVKSQINKIKLNCVIMRGFNDDEIIDFASLTTKYPIEVRFIEFMPFAGNKWEAARVVANGEVLRILKTKFPNLKAIATEPSDTSRLYKEHHSMIGEIGFISSMSDLFCSGCNRLRITSDGHLKVCLFGKDEVSLRDLIRTGATDDELIASISQALNRKKKQHGDANELLRNTNRPMIKIASGHHKLESLAGNVIGRRNLSDFTHLDYQGQARMVDISSKRPIDRQAVAQGCINVNKDVIDKLRSSGYLEKGDVMGTARLAGIMAAKMTSQLIPLCHQITLNSVVINLEVNDTSSSITVQATVASNHRTGVEMESLVAVSIALLTIYDMCKSIDKQMTISDIRLVKKIKAGDQSDR